MSSAPGRTRAPSWTARPLTFTRPAVMRSSHARREPRPAEARNFCSRTPMDSSEVFTVMPVRLLRLGLWQGEHSRAFLPLAALFQKLDALKPLQHVPLRGQRAG